jgi:hypothetical protein
MKYKVVMSERQADGTVRTFSQTAFCGSKEDVIKFYGLDKPDIVSYSIEEA